MSENLTTNVELDSTANGTVSFATDVVATIAGLAATEVDGVAAMINSGNLGLVDMLRKNQGNRPLTRGVKVEINGDKVIVQLNVTVDYGSPVPVVAREIQDNVKKAIETMTGLEVPEINIYVQGISFEKENRAMAELEQKQRAALTAAKVERLGRGEEPKAEEKPEDDEDKRAKQRRGSGFSLRRREDKPEGEGEDDAQPDAPADKPEQPEAAPQDEPAAEEAPADEPQTVQADEQPADADEGETGEDDEPVCDGHCDTCTLECDAAERGEAAAEQADERPKGEDSAE